jgi:hypothetical protein
MSESPPDALGAYEAYLQRFGDALGEVAVGGFAKHNGQLVQKMSPGEFEAQRLEYEHLYATYERAMIRGDTINDMVMRMLRENAAKLLQEAPAEL